MEDGKATSFKRGNMELFCDPWKVGDRPAVKFFEFGELLQ